MTRAAAVRFTAVLSVILVLCACGGNSPQSTSSTDLSGTRDTTNVFVGGYECTTPWGGTCTGTYWKNGQIVYVGDSSELPILTSMAVSGSDIYVAGFRVNRASTEFPHVATYWKNGTAVALTDGATDGHATAITVSGSDVYVAGWEGEPVARSEGGPVAVAKYWKNGTPVSLSDGTKAAFANAIAVSGNDVHVVGTEGAEATYWKNGTAVHLGVGNAGSSWANALAISGGDVHIAGGAMTRMEGGWAGVATYWKNRTVTTLGMGTRISDASSIAVSGGDVYVAGGEIDRDGQAGQMVAKYWKNGAAVALSDGTKYDYARAIAIVGNDIYIAIMETDALPGISGTASRSDAKYWKNGTVVPLPHTSGMVYAEPIFIFVDAH